MFGDCLRVQEGACVKETEMGCSEEGLYWRAEECLVHVLDPVLNVGNGVDVVQLMCWCVGGGMGEAWTRM